MVLLPILQWEICTGSECETTLTDEGSACWGRIVDQRTGVDVVEAARMHVWSRRGWVCATPLFSATGCHAPEAFEGSLRTSAKLPITRSINAENDAESVKLAIAPGRSTVG